MRILVTGANGFAGRNLCESLSCVQQGKDRTRAFTVEQIWRYDVDSDPEILKEAASRCDYVLHFAGVNRPRNESEFYSGNVGFTEKLISLLEACGNPCPVLYASSVQATLSGRYADSPYGKSKLQAEELLRQHEKKTGAKVYLYRFPNLFGKWCRPGYNSAVATFCSQAANRMPLSIHQPDTMLELLYIDDLTESVFSALLGQVTRCEYEGTDSVRCEDGRYCLALPTHHVTLGQIGELLQSFQSFESTLTMAELPANSFAKKLFSAYLTYLPRERISIPLTMHSDDRGSFTEILKTKTSGQFSVNISKPGITKGQHWHHSKWELFVVVHGRALISERNLLTGERVDLEVSGEKIEAVQMLPGWTHSIQNLSQTEDLVTLMWANENFDPNHPDTFYEPV